MSPTSRIAQSEKVNGPRTDASHTQDSELARVLDAYLAAMEAGQAIEPTALAAAHPAIAERLLACLSVLRVAGQVEGRGGGAPGSDVALGPGAENCLGDFRILRVIGRGGMGIVFEAEQVSLKRKVALKVLPFAAALDPQQLRRFEIEAQAAAQLHHTNIVPIFSVGCERGVHYYAMQYIDGQTLAALIHDLRQMAGVAAVPSAEPPAGSVSLAEELLSGRLAPGAIAPAGETPPESPVSGPPLTTHHSQRAKLARTTHHSLAPEGRKPISAPPLTWPCNPPKASTTPIARESSTATSSRPICSSTCVATSGSPTSAWPACRPTAV